jgi:hypothetical protein
MIPSSGRAGITAGYCNACHAEGSSDNFNPNMVRARLELQKASVCLIPDVCFLSTAEH